VSALPFQECPIKINLILARGLPFAFFTSFLFSLEYAAFDRAHLFNEDFAVQNDHFVKYTAAVN